METGDTEDEGVRGRWREWRQKDRKMGKMEEKWRGGGIENGGMGRLKSEGKSRVEDRGMGVRWEDKRWRNRRAGR